MKVAIIDYGAGNVTSLAFALKRVGVESISITFEADELLRSDAVIFPGVGHAAFAMHQLKNYQLDKVIPELKQPFLGICLGMQLMCEHTEEGNCDGLGIFNVKVKQFPDHLKVPHMGWNTVVPSSDTRLIESDDWFYFVHSYYAEISIHTVGKTDYMLDFSAILHKDNFIGCQFHPEKSAVLGEKYLKSFLNLVE